MKHKKSALLLTVTLSIIASAASYGQSSERNPVSLSHYTPDPVMEARVHKRGLLLQAAIRDGNAALEDKKYERAISLYQTALGIWRDDEALLGLAEAYEKTNRQSLALQTYHMLAHPGPYERSGTIGTDPTSRMRYVLLLLQNDRWSEAVQEYNAALNPNNPTLSSYFLKSAKEFSADRPEWSRLESMAHLLLGTLRPGHKEVSREEFVTHLKRAAQLQPADATLRLYLADGLRNANHSVEARREYRTAEILAANDPETRALAHKRYVETAVKADPTNDTIGTKK